LRVATSKITRKPLIVLGTSFYTTENLAMCKENDFDYLYVTRAKWEDYNVINQDLPQVELQDNRKNKINVEFVTKKKSKNAADKVHDNETFLYIQGGKKAVKEASMQTKFSIKFKAEFSNLIAGLLKVRGTKTLEKVEERLGKTKICICPKILRHRNHRKGRYSFQHYLPKEKKRDKIDQRRLFYKNIPKRPQGKRYLTNL
jgi:hypothetical protein